MMEKEKRDIENSIETSLKFEEMELVETLSSKRDYCLGFAAGVGLVFVTVCICCT